jgi:hypothetical protein
MEADDGQPPSNMEDQRSMQVDNAIRAIREKKPVPEIDFTIHTMEDGSQVNTQERVCKGAHARSSSNTPPPPFAVLLTPSYPAATCILSRASTCSPLMHFFLLPGLYSSANLLI